MRTIIFTLCIAITLGLNGQSDTTYTMSYMDKSTRFAWLTYGGDLNFLTGGRTQQFVNGVKQDMDFGVNLVPRLTIGGIHFWGHVDFYVTFPLSFLSYQDVPAGLEDLELYQGVETGLRVYPFKLKPKAISPFAGISFRSIRFAQESEESGFSNGTPNYGRFINPVQFGLTYTTAKWHITASGYYNHQNQFDYFISPEEIAAVELDPLSFNLSFLKYFDADRYARTPRAVAQINKDYNSLKAQKKLSSWFVGIGPSSALQQSKSPYLKENFPFFYDDYSASIMPDIAFGRYFDKPDLNVNLTYRTYGKTYEGFDAKINTRRHSAGIESTKFLFNWLGFVPFAGAALTYENLSATVNGTDYNEDKIALGIVFGWDIRVVKTNTNLLRTNLRYYPNLHMNIDGEKMMFDHLEFNFIQWVYFIGRKKALRN